MCICTSTKTRRRKRAMDDKIVGFKINSQGFGTIPKLVMQDRSLSLGAKAVYAYFCSFTGAGDSCFPSRERICYDLDLNKDTFTKYRNELVTRGYIKIEQIKDGVKFSHNVYTLCDVVPSCPVFSDTKISDPKVSDPKEPDTINNSIKSNNIKSNNTLSTADKPQRERKRFVKPTVEEVAAYCRERQNTVDAEEFVAYYESNGWKVGKNPMVNWKQSVITWECKRKNEQKAKNGTPIYDPDAEGLKY